MRLKPKSTVKNPLALQYKRFIGIETSNTLSTAYKTEDGKYWLFDSETLTFIEIGADKVANSAIKNIGNETSIVQYQGKYFRYINLAWEETTPNGANLVLLSATFNNVAKYQMNKYYFVGSFDYIIKGSTEGSTTQYLKGNITPLTSFSIKHYNDEINLSTDDLVVIDGHLYAVENPETNHKYQPKDYKVHFATLIGIL